MREREGGIRSFYIFFHEAGKEQTNSASLLVFCLISFRWWTLVLSEEEPDKTGSGSGPDASHLLNKEILFLSYYRRERDRQCQASHAMSI